MQIAALPVFLPLLGAAALVALRRWLPRLAVDAIATAVAVAVAALGAALLARTAGGHPFAYWMGGWRPRHAVAIGISLSIDPLGAGLATFAALLVTASLIFSWRYFKDVHGLFQALMLVFLAAMVGFSLTGDLFNLAIFFELMSAVAYALTAYRPEERGPLQGAINFAVTNSIGAYAIFAGIALLYARTGALNMAQIGAALDGHRADPLVAVAMALLFCGFLTKAAAVPLHFWLADAHAVAPSPVCALFSGVMVELGVYAVARIYWTIFAGPLGPHAEQLRAILIALGTLTALWGAVMCFAQRHLKRLLAFSTISHVGVLLCGVGLLGPAGLTGAAIYVVGHGLTKAALFMLTGVLLHRFATVDELELRARGRELPVAGALYALAGLVLSAVPAVTLFYGKALLDGAALAVGYPWLPAISLVASMLTGGAVLRASGRIFLGWGARARGAGVEARAAREREDEESAPRKRTPPLMLVVPAVLLAGAIALGLIPGAFGAIQLAAGHFRDQRSYVDWVLRGVVRFPAAAAPARIEPDDWAYGAAAAAGALALAALALFGGSLRRRLPAGWLAPPAAALAGLRHLHSGHIGDYIAWWTAGAAALGGASLLLLR
jgi:multicomponent Na+:H+ antiporter subunit D